MLCEAVSGTVGVQVVALAVEVAEAFRDLLQLNHRMGRIQVRAAAMHAQDQLFCCSMWACCRGSMQAC